jgi:hypothetical protein
MRTVLLAAIALVSGCLAESAGGPAVYHPTENASVATVCADERPTGSNINRTVCREPPSPDEKMESLMWRNKLPASPFSGGSHVTDTPGVRVYR